MLCLVMTQKLAFHFQKNLSNVDYFVRFLLCACVCVCVLYDGIHVRRIHVPRQSAQKIHAEDVERDHFDRSAPCRDAGWALAFVSCTLVVVVLALTRGVPEWRIAAEEGARRDAARHAEMEEYQQQVSQQGGQEEESYTGAEDSGGGDGGGGGPGTLLFACAAMAFAAGCAALAVFEVCGEIPCSFCTHSLSLTNLRLGSERG